MSSAARGSVVVGTATEDAACTEEIGLAEPAKVAPTAKRPPPPTFSSAAIKELEQQSLDARQHPPSSPRSRPQVPKLSPRELLSPLVAVIGDTPLMDCSAEAGQGTDVVLPEPVTIAGTRKRRVLGELHCRSRAELLQRANVTLVASPVRSDAVVLNLAADDLARQLEHAPLTRVVHGSGAKCAEDAVYAALVGRRNLTVVLQRFVEARDLTEVEAMEIALDILFRNSQR